MADVYGDSAPSYRTVAKWVAEFIDPTRAFEDVPRSCRLPTTLTDESIRPVEKVVMRDRQISVRRVADELGITKASLYEVLSDYLGMKKVCTKWAPKLLTLSQRVNRIDCYEEFLYNCNQAPTEYFGRIVTGNKT